MEKGAIANPANVAKWNGAAPAWEPVSRLAMTGVPIVINRQRPSIPVRARALRF